MASKLLVNELQAATGTDITITAGHSLVGAASVFKIAGGIAGQALITDGAGNISFGTVSSLPTQSGQAGKFLKTDGTDASWGTVATDPTMGGDLTGTASNAQIAAGAVDTAEIAADAVTSNEIAAGAVSGTEVAATFDLSGKTVTLAAGEVSASEMATTLDLSGKTVTLPAASVTAHVTSYDDSDLQNDIALLGFKIAAGDTAVKYSLANQIIDDFQSEAGIDTSTSVDEEYDSSGKYYQAGTSALANYVAKGGGRGGPRGSGSACDGGDGGSGGGGGTTGGDGHTSTAGVSNKNTYSGWSSYGSNGGVGQHVGGSHEGGGGGGGGNSSGTNGTSFSGGQGGSGAIGYETGISGSSTYYAGGGGAGGNSSGSNGNGGGSTANRGGGGGVNQSGGSGIVIFSYTPSGGSLTVSSITATGTFTIPTGVSQTDVLIVGGGGGSGSGSSAGGGGGGGVLRHTTFGVTAGDTWDITIGPGGAANTNGTDTTLAHNVANATMTLVSNANTAEAIPTKGDLVFTYADAIGTATYSGGSPTITAFISRDGSAYTSALTLTKVGTTGTQTILAAHDVDLTGIASGTAMKYKIVTSGQGALMHTRIHAVSLGWS